jgi:monoamine oxidase
MARVTLADGRTLDADDVVLTAPPAVWRKIAFDPPLPAALAPQMGSNVKFLIGLKDRFWRRTSVSPESLSDGPVHLTWEATDNQKGAAGAAMVAFSGGPSAEICREWSATERTAKYLAESRACIRAFAPVSCAPASWTALDRWSARHSFPARTVTPKVRCCGPGKQLHLPANTPATPSSE